MSDPKKEKEARYWVIPIEHLPPDGAGITGARLAGFARWRRAKVAARKSAKEEEKAFAIVSIIERIGGRR